MLYNCFPPDEFFQAVVVGSVGVFIYIYVSLFLSMNILSGSIFFFYLKKQTQEVFGPRNPPEYSRSSCCTIAPCKNLSAQGKPFLAA